MTHDHERPTEPTPNLHCTNSGLSMACVILQPMQQTKLLYKQKLIFFEPEWEQMVPPDWPQKLGMRGNCTLSESVDEEQMSNGELHGHVATEIQHVA